MPGGATRILSHTSGPDSLAVRRGTLKVTRGKDKGRQVELKGPGQLVIGSDPEAGLVLTDDSVSRQHAELSLSEQGYLIRDLGSTNGIRIGGALVREGQLDAKVTLSLGETDLLFTLADEEIEYPLSGRRQFGDLYGQGVVMRELFAVLERAALTESSVLIEGESGTGKESIAEGLHRASARASGPFSVIDCGAIPPNLIESELFGHVKGAFTGALEAREGAFREAHSGTLFLDEIGELPLELQPKFLRALERKQIKRVGGSDYDEVDIRVIAATNRDLEKLVKEGKFRSDLYFRLAVVRVQAPPLRAHPEDIPLLAGHFVQQIRPGVDPAEFLTAGVLGAFRGYAWPGNVRELRNAIERLLALGDWRNQDPGGAPLPPSGSYEQARRAALDRFERAYCEAMLEAADGVVAKAAERAGISRQMFYRLLQKHGVSGA